MDIQTLIQLLVQKYLLPLFIVLRNVSKNLLIFYYNFTVIE